MLKVGCCGGFSKKALFLDLIEIQATFYKIPKEETLKKWRQTAPTNFEFSIKASQIITHPPSSPTYRKAGIYPTQDMGFFKDTQQVYNAYHKTKKAAEILNARFVVFQTPHSFNEKEEHIKNLYNFFEKIDRGGFLFVLELRGWEKNFVKNLCKDLEVIECADPFEHLPQDRQIAYFRLHGCPPGEKLYNYKYTQEDIRSLLNFCSQYNEVYCLFNNIYMWEDALNFKKMLSY